MLLALVTCLWVCAEQLSENSIEVSGLSHLRRGCPEALPTFQCTTKSGALAQNPPPPQFLQSLFASASIAHPKLDSEGLQEPRNALSLPELCGLRYQPTELPKALNQGISLKPQRGSYRRLRYIMLLP